MANGADQFLEVMIRLGFIGQDQADAARKALDGIKDSGKDLTEKMDYLPDSLKNVGDAAQESGRKISTTREQHMALHHAMTELNRLVPGLGTSFHFLSEGFIKAGESSEGAAGGVDAFKAALSSAMDTLLPLLAVMLTIETATHLLDGYKNKLKEVAGEQTDAMGKIEESTNRAIEAVQRLDDALHPRKTLAEQDQKALEDRITKLKEEQAAQKEINKANEERELAAAVNEEQKGAITMRYTLMNSRIDELTQSQIAGFQSAAAEHAQQQIADIDAKIAARKAQLDEGNARLQAEADEYKRQLQALDFTHDPSGAGRADLGQRIAGIETAIAKRNDDFANFVDQTKSGAGNLGTVGQGFQASADQSQATSDRQRATQAQVLRDQRAAEQTNQILDFKDTANFGNETLRKLLEATKASHAETQAIVNEIIAGHLTLTQEMAYLRGLLRSQGNAGQ